MSALITILLLICAVIYTIVKSRKIQKMENRDHTDLASANRTIGELDARVLNYAAQVQKLSADLAEQQEKFGKLQHQKISADVKMGQKSENLLPFLSAFPYADEEIRGLFNPIDLVVFTDDSVVFVEVKTGSAQLSDKQRRIRDNIKAGRVRFEVHRMDEKGVKIK